MGAFPLQEKSDTPSRSREELPDYLPARMVNEFAYCPRLFFYEWVEGLFAESADTVEGKIQHERVDEKSTAFQEASELPETIHARSVSLASERLHVIAKMDLVEADGHTVTPVDYKHESPAKAPMAWNCGLPIAPNWPCKGLWRGRHCLLSQNRPASPGGNRRNTDRDRL